MVAVACTTALSFGRKNLNCCLGDGDIGSEVPCSCKRAIDGNLEPLHKQKVVASLERLPYITSVDLEFPRLHVRSPYVALDMNTTRSCLVV